MGDTRMKWTDAWQQLVYEHSPFRAADVADFQRLLRQVGEFERLLLANRDLEQYASELSAPNPSEAPALKPPPPSPPHQVRHAAAIQLQLMEEAFYALRLDRHANAPDNRGWMNLFRRWAASPTFQTQVALLEKTASRRFISFYYHYIEGWKEDVPVPHPWDVRADDRRAERKAKGGAPEMFSGITKDGLRICRERATKSYKGKGIFLDPGLVEAGHQDSFDEPHRVMPGQHGTTETPPASAPAPPPAGSEDSSKSTD
jgi:hypothetical protein